MSLKAAGQFHSSESEELLLSSYDYELPPNRIAQAPATPRDSSKLLFLSRKEQKFEDFRFNDLPQLLQKGDLLVFNNTRVVPARVVMDRGEILFVRPANNESTDDIECWDCLVFPGKNFKPGSHLELPGNLRARVLTQSQIGRLIEFHGNVKSYLEEWGSIPLPPYIQRPPDRKDRERYQTIYARIAGSVAAPTAGLHFTRRVFQALKERGVEKTTITLHVGPGTFRPVKSDMISAHRIDPEYYRCSRSTWRKIESASRVVVAGTTTTRAVESIARTGELRGSTDLFLYPGQEFRIVKGLITNFHLPKSSLLMLVAAFTGLDTLKRAYQHAIEADYRFYSYGDAMLIL